jgi:hypothetical protein
LRIEFLAAMLACLAGCAEDADSRLSAELLGTWVISEKAQVVGEATYSGDGAIAGFVVSPQRTVMGSELTFKLRAHWKVENGVLHLRDFETDPNGLFPPGHTQRYKIVSLTDSEAVFRDLDKGTDLVRRRRSF